MGYLIGTDEAGYGPNLGPLVVSATAWQIPDHLPGDELYRVLEDVVVQTARDANAPGRCRLAIADSKALYKPKSSLKQLERGLLATLALLDRNPSDWRDVWQALAPDSEDALHSIPWYTDYHGPIPIDADANERERLAKTLGEGLAAAGVRLIGFRSRAVFPGEFNRLLDVHNGKGGLLSNVTLRLVTQLSGPLEQGPISVICDKHGGRNRYSHLLAEHFPDSLIEIRGEGRQQSVYRFGPTERRFEFRFQTKGEAYLPAALASMASKYLRELAMRAFNRFWCDRVDGLRPTAGYPQDAKRFKAQIEAARIELGIDDRTVWRIK